MGKELVFMICLLFLPVETIKVKTFPMEINVVSILEYPELLAHFSKTSRYLHDVSNEKIPKTF